MLHCWFPVTNQESDLPFLSKVYSVLFDNLRLKISIDLRLVVAAESLQQPFTVEQN